MTHESRVQALPADGSAAATALHHALIAPTALAAPRKSAKPKPVKASARKKKAAVPALAPPASESEFRQENRKPLESKKNSQKLKRKLAVRS